MSEKVHIAYKKLGQTPLECLLELKKNYPKWADLPMTYAGRLDPMAEGLMIILMGDECKNKDPYLKLDKTYEFQVLVGFETDTYDLLGKVATPKVVLERSSDLLSGLRPAGQTISKASFCSALENFQGTFIQKYPSFSSKTAGGKQLFQLSKDDELPDELPEHEVTITKLSCTSTMILKKGELEKEILQRISLVKGDFRQEEIIKAWQKVFEDRDQIQYSILSCIAECSSGTYIRQLVHDLGQQLGIPLVTYSIKRTKVGDYTTNDIADQ